MAFDTTRRSFIAGIGAAAAAPLLPQPAFAADSAGPAYRSATEIVATLVDKKISARELVDSAIARIEALDPKINAVVVRDFDRAREAARAADEALANGETKPLLGVPMTVKEQFNVAGLPTTWGYPKFKDWKPEVDALAVQRLKSAGAIILGKTNVPTALSDWQSFNDVYGTTNNPWDPSRTPGGSSGGAAAALAAGFVPLELGSDIAGSLRSPAHYCGVCAHKPSLDLVPQRGSGYPETPPIPVRGDMAVAGPMARSAADLALELGVIAGPDPMWDGIGYKLALPPPRHDKLADYRVLVIDKHPLCPTADSVRAALNVLADRLAKAGSTVGRQNAKMPDLATPPATTASCSWRFSPATCRPRSGWRSRPRHRCCPRKTRASLLIACAAWRSATRNGSVRARCETLCGHVGRRCSRTSMSCCARRCRLRPFRTTIPSRATSAKSISTARRCPTSTRSPGPGSPP